MVTVFSAVGGPVAATVGVMTGLAEGTLILAFVTPRRYRYGDEADLPVRSRWWVPVWTVFRLRQSGFFVVACPGVHGNRSGIGSANGCGLRR